MIINDSTSNDIIYPTEFGRGHDPKQVPLQSGIPSLFGDAPGQMQIIPRHEWQARIQEMHATKSTLRHLRERAANGQQMPTLDQGREGYCWAYSVTRTVMYLRALANRIYKRLSGHAVGCMIKNYRDEGGWCGLSLNFIRERGVPSVETWPEKSFSRSNDNAGTWAEAAGNKIVEGWYDVAKSAYDQELSYDQMMTCLLLNIPVAADFNWWGHSVCLHTPVWLDGEACPEGDNSWTDSFGEQGRFKLQGNKARPDGAVAIRAIAVDVN